MSDTSEVVIDLLKYPAYYVMLTNNLNSFKGKRRLEYVRWLKSIGLEVQPR